MSQVLDLDKFCPEPKSIKLGGKEFDVTMIPFELTLKLYELIPTMQKLEDTKKIEVEDYNKILKLILDILQLTDETITFKWLTRQINIERFNEITPFIFSAIFDSSKKKSESVDDLPKSTLDV